MVYSEPDERLSEFTRCLVSGQIITTTALILRSALRYNHLQWPGPATALFLQTEEAVLNGLLETFQALCLQCQQDPLETLEQYTGGIQAIAAERSLYIYWLDDATQDQLMEAQTLASKLLSERPEPEPSHSGLIVDELIQRSILRR